MKIGYKDDKQKVEFRELNKGDLFEYGGDFCIKINTHKIDCCGVLRDYNAVQLEDGSSCWFDMISLVTPVEFVGYAEVRKDEN